MSVPWLELGSRLQLGDFTPSESSSCHLDTLRLDNAGELSLSENAVDMKSDFSMDDTWTSSPIKAWIVLVVKGVAQKKRTIPGEFRENI